MLFFVDGNLLDIVRENSYVDVLTVRSSSRDALKPLTRFTGAKILRVPDQFYPWILHIPKASAQLDIHYRHFGDTELVSRLTPEPQAYYFDYCYENDDGELIGDYGYCWPHEITETIQYLRHRENPALDVPTFVPLFYMPYELLAAS